MKISKDLDQFLRQFYQRKIDAFYASRRAVAREVSKKLTDSPEYANYIKAANALKEKVNELLDENPLFFSVDIRDLTQWAPEHLFCANEKFECADDLRLEHSQLLAQISLAKNSDEVRVLLRMKEILPPTDDKESTT
jgi:hypothetical protein